MRKWAAGIVSSIIVGVTVWWLTSQVFGPGPSDPDRADILVCLRGFSYEGQPTQSGFIRPRGSASFRLVNVGNLGATVSRVQFTPVGVSPDGKQGGLVTFDIEVDAHVPARGVTSMESVQLVTNFVVSPEQWFDEPRYVHASASWPGSSRSVTLQCRVFGGRWTCGKVQVSNGLSMGVNPACG